MGTPTPGAPVHASGREWSIFGPVADRLSRLRGFLKNQFEERSTLRKGPFELPNTTEIARRIGVHQSTIHRILYGKRNIRSADERVRPLPEYRESQELRDGLMRAFGFTTEGELSDAIDASPPCGPLPRPTKKARAPRKRKRPRSAPR